MDKKSNSYPVIISGSSYMWVAMALPWYKAYPPEPNALSEALIFTRDSFL